MRIEQDLNNIFKHKEDMKLHIFVFLRHMYGDFNVKHTADLNVYPYSYDNKYMVYNSKQINCSMSKRHF